MEARKMKAMEYDKQKQYVAAVWILFNFPSSLQSLSFLHPTSFHFLYFSVFLFYFQPVNSLGKRKQVEVLRGYYACLLSHTLNSVIFSVSGMACCAIH